VFPPVGQVPAAAAAAVPVADAETLLLLPLLLLELHAAVNASSAITKTIDNFRSTSFPPWTIIRTIEC
jgi:hypothetical protein